MAAIVARELRLAPYVAGLAVIAIPVVLVGYFADALAGAAVLYLVIVLVVGALYFLVIRPRARRDLDAGVFVRSRGPIGMARYDQGGDYVLTPDGASLAVELDVVRAVKGMPGPRGEVDYSPGAEVLFEIRDAAGRIVWRDRRLDE